MLGRWLWKAVGRTFEAVLAFAWIFISFALVAALIFGLSRVVVGTDAEWVMAIVGLLAIPLGLAIFVLGRDVLAPRWGYSGRRMKRALTLNRWGRAHGWSIDVLKGDRTLPARGFPFNMGGEHTTLAAVGGRHRGRDAMVVYYTVKENEGPDSLAVDFTIVAIGADADFPITIVYPQRRASQLKSLVGFQDIDVESAAFNRRWRVVGTDERGSHAILSPRVIDRLTSPDAGGFPIAWDSNAVMVVQHGLSKRWTRLEAQLDLLAELAALVPGYMTRKGGATRGMSRASLDGVKTIEAPWIAPSRGALTLRLLGGTLIVGSVFLTGLGHAVYPLACAGTGIALFPLASWYEWLYKARRRREWVARANTQF